MNILFFVIAILCLVEHNTKETSKEAEKPIINIVHGMIRGSVSLSRNDRVFYEFKGIPYAKPPTNELRFKAPVAPDPWSGIRDTQENAPICIQKNYFFLNPTLIGSEDCLYLNVYTPKLRIGQDEDNLPVMVFVHWGGFIAGSSHSNYLGPEYFMDQDIVLITFNYRLGALGFLSTNDDEAPGNYALKDQLAVLKWVQQNIENFGGDKNRVTIFGSSAGAASVHYHVLSPISKGLFHRAISQSGSVLAPWAKPIGIEKQLAIMQGNFVGCNNISDTKILVDCLRNVDASDIVNSGDNFKFFSIDPLCVFLPSIENETEKNPEPFITKQPIEYIRNQEFNAVPYIIGVNSDEGIMRAAGLLRQQETRYILNKKFDELMPQMMALMSAAPKENISQIWEEIKDFYLGGEDTVNISNPNSIQGLINLYTDRAFIYGSYQSALLHSKMGHDNLWFYHFNYKGQYSYGEHFAATHDDDVDYDWGVSHCDELIYLFKSIGLFDDLESKNDLLMSTILIKIWTNFARYGTPTPSQNVARDGTWLTVGTDLLGDNENKDIRFLNLTGSYRIRDSIKLKMEIGLYNDRMRFWENLPLADNIEDLLQTHIELE